MKRSDIFFAPAVTLIFLLISMGVVLRHELWIDEAYHFLLSANSRSVAQIIEQGSSSGHPVLWNILLFFYAKLFPGVQAMQILHVLIATACISLIVFFAPFTRLEKVFVCFGYFFLYEYNIISKNYIPGFFLVFLSVVLWSRSNRHFALHAILLGVAANLHLFTLFVSFFLFLYYLLQEKSGRGTATFRIAGFVIISFLVVALLQIIPRGEIIESYRSFDTPDLLSFTRFKRAFGSFAKGLLNIPDYRTIRFWNSNLLYNIHHSLIYLCSLILVPVIYRGLDKKHRLLFFGPALSIMCFVYFAPLSTGVRYWGYYYVLLIICFWLQTERKTFFRVVFYTVTGVQFLVSWPALALDYAHPFSNSKNAASSLGDKSLTRLPLYTETLALGPSLCAYTGEKVFYPSNKSFETFNYWIKNESYSPSGFVRAAITTRAYASNDTVVLVMKHTIPDEDLARREPGVEIVPIDSLTGAMLSFEDYYLYLLVFKD